LWGCGCATGDLVVAVITRQRAYARRSRRRRACRTAPSSAARSAPMLAAPHTANAALDVRASAPSQTGQSARSSRRMIAIRFTPRRRIASSTSPTATAAAPSPGQQRGDLRDRQGVGPTLDRASSSQRLDVGREPGGRAPWPRAAELRRVWTTTGDHRLAARARAADRDQQPRGPREAAGRDPRQVVEHCCSARRREALQISASARDPSRARSRTGRSHRAPPRCRHAVVWAASVRARATATWDEVRAIKSLCRSRARATRARLVILS